VENGQKRVRNDIFIGFGGVVNWNRVDVQDGNLACRFGRKGAYWVLGLSSDPKERMRYEGPIVGREDE
jgi:hypothetical protein